MRMSNGSHVFMRKIIVEGYSPRSVTKSFHLHKQALDYAIPHDRRHSFATHMIAEKMDRHDGQLPRPFEYFVSVDNPL